MEYMERVGGRRCSVLGASTATVTSR